MASPQRGLRGMRVLVAEDVARRLRERSRDVARGVAFTCAGWAGRAGPVGPYRAHGPPHVGARPEEGAATPGKENLQGTMESMCA